MPVPRDTDFADYLLRRLHALLDGFWVRTDAPFFVRMHAWLPTQVSALVLHWVNYRQMEETPVETRLPSGRIRVDCRVTDERGVNRAKWLFSEAVEGTALKNEEGNDSTHFVLP